MATDKAHASFDLYKTIGRLGHHLDLFGDELARRQNYKAHTGMDAVHFYLVQKHNWFPAQVRSLSIEDLRFLLDEEMAGWTIPKKDMVATD